jgi:tetratricopeptide (TPR) repeat protein
MYSNRLIEAITHGERSIALARRLNLTEQLAYTLNDVAHCYWTLGQLDRAIVSLNEAGTLWRQLDNLPMLADSLSTLVSVRIFAGDFDQALKASEEAYQISRSINNRWGRAYSKYKSGLVHWERGNPNGAIADMEESITWGRLAGFMAPLANTAADLARVYGSLGAVEHGLEIARQAMTVADTQLPMYRVYVCGVRAELHLLDGNLAEAEAAVELGYNDPNREGFPAYFMLFRTAAGKVALAQGEYPQAIEIADKMLLDLRRSGMRLQLPEALLIKGEALLALSQPDPARACLAEARAEAEATGSRRMLWQILVELGRLESGSEVAQALRQRAREIVVGMAGNISDAGLRASFLDLPRVRSLLEPAAGEA